VLEQQVAACQVKDTLLEYHEIPMASSQFHLYPQKSRASHVKVCKPFALAGPEMTQETASIPRQQVMHEFYVLLLPSLSKHSEVATLLIA
jgi:hypothetical protein